MYKLRISLNIQTNLPITVTSPPIYSLAYPSEPSRAPRLLLLLLLLSAVLSEGELERAEAVVRHAQRRQARERRRRVERPGQRGGLERRHLRTRGTSG